VTFLPDCVGKEVQEATKSPEKGTVFLLENLRFHPEEEGKGVAEDGKKFQAEPNDVKAFREELSKLGDIFINDAFGTAHRAHSSMVGVTHSIKAAGFLMKAELHAFSKLLDHPKRPFVAVLGGAKIGDKIPLIKNLLNVVDELIIGGGMAFTFLKVLKGMEIGKSLFDEEGAKMVHELVNKAKEKKVKIHLPVDFREGDSKNKDCKVQDAYLKTGITPGWIGMDSGPLTWLHNAQVIWNAQTVLFNGPQGVFELPAFAAGTHSTMQAMAAITKFREAVTIVGGGDSAAACSRFGLEPFMTHVSTGGGAGLELLEGKKLPGIQALGEKLPSKL